MNKFFIGGIVGVVVIGAIAVFVLNMSSTTNGTEIQANDPGNTISRPAVQAVPNTFSIMTPEEKAASDEAARIKAEAELLATSSATTSEAELESEVEIELEAGSN
jgi:hypothetical protein